MVGFGVSNQITACSQISSAKKNKQTGTKKKTGESVASLPLSLSPSRPPPATTPDIFAAAHTIHQISVPHISSAPRHSRLVLLVLRATSPPRPQLAPSALLGLRRLGPQSLVERQDRVFGGEKAALFLRRIGLVLLPLLRVGGGDGLRNGGRAGAA